MVGTLIIHVKSRHKRFAAHFYKTVSLAIRYIRDKVYANSRSIPLHVIIKVCCDI